MSGRDDGLQQERTHLAWRRTGLALAAGALITLRFTLGRSPLVLALALCCLALAAGAVVTTLRTRWFSVRSLAETAYDEMLVDGRLPATVAAGTGLLALTEAAVLLG